MKKTLSLGVLFLCFCITGCLNFHPNKQKQETEESTEKVVENDPQDDAAMESSVHMKFKGVPIDGTLADFVGRMKRKGFKQEDIEDGTAVLSGDFADFKECTVYVSTLDNKDLVSRISVVFPLQDQWEYLYGDYKHLKGMLTEKYGKPSSCVEKFQRSYGIGPNDDDDRMHYAKFDKCKYETHFKTDKGDVIVSIEHNGVSSCFVMLSYKDKINGDIIKEHAKEDL